MENNEKIHHGQNIRRFREVMDMKQETLATELGGDWTQRKISLLEQKETIEPEILEQVAKVLKVPVNAIERFTTQAAVTYFNTYNEQVGTAVNGNANHCTFNPLDELLKSWDKTKELYEQLLKVEREKAALLEKMIGK